MGDDFRNQAPTDFLRYLYRNQMVHPAQLVVLRIDHNENHCEIELTRSDEDEKNIRKN